MRSKTGRAGLAAGVPDTCTCDETNIMSFEAPGKKSPRLSARGSSPISSTSLPLSARNNLVQTLPVVLPQILARLALAIDIERDAVWLPHGKTPVAPRMAFERRDHRQPLRGQLPMLRIHVIDREIVNPPRSAAEVVPRLGGRDDLQGQSHIAEFEIHPPPAIERRPCPEMPRLRISRCR